MTDDECRRRAPEAWQPDDDYSLAAGWWALPGAVLGGLALGYGLAALLGWLL